MAYQEFRCLIDLERKPSLSERMEMSASIAMNAEIASLVEYLVAAHGAGAGAIADAVCASAEAAGNGRQARLWRQVRTEIGARP